MEIPPGQKSKMVHTSAVVETHNGGVRDRKDNNKVKNLNKSIFYPRNKYKSKISLFLHS